MSLCLTQNKILANFWVVVGIVLLAASSTVKADSTDIASEPLITKADVSAKPNLMFIMDTSGSMASFYMPDEMSGTGRYGYYSSQCNGVAFNPATVYDPPVDSTGVAYSNAIFKSAKDDGYVTSSSTVNLNGVNGSFTFTSGSVSMGTGTKVFTYITTSSDNSFNTGDPVYIATSSSASTYMIGSVTGFSTSTSPTWPFATTTTLTVNVTTNTGSGSSTTWYIGKPAFYYSYSGSEAALNWTYDSVGDAITSSTFYQECRSNIGSSPGSGVFTKVYVTSESANATNYANWYSFYRSRILMMRTSAGRAFSGLDSNYRVGFTIIRDTNVSDGTNYFRDVKDFGATQKSNFYDSLYSASTGSATPLRGALAKVGRYYAKKVSGQTYDPMEYSCQRNYAILSTDGYWNTNNESSSYGPDQLDGSTNVGNQDGTEDRPMFDGTVSTTKSTRYKYVVSGPDCNCTGKKPKVCTEYTVQTTQQVYSTTWVDYGSTASQCVLGTTTLVLSSGTQTVSSLTGTTVYSATTPTVFTSGGSSNSLADVAEYYYKTDLRTSALSNCSSSTSGSTQDICDNSLVAAGRDLATYQHLTTYTIGLGVNGTLPYSRTYLSDTTGSYVKLKNGDIDWPTPVETSTGGDARNIDDLWHAAVNGRGVYYSAQNATELSNAIKSVVTEIQAVQGSASAATTNRLELVSGSSNVAYQASYTTSTWTGDLQAFAVDGDTGAQASTASWSAQAKLDSTTYTTRNIYFNKSGVLTAFQYGNLTATQQAYFNNICSKTIVASQCAGLSASNLVLANNGDNLVNFLRGDRTYETSNVSSPLYRKRSNVLGDIINSTPAYMGPPPFSYEDSGYAAYVSSKAGRTKMVFVGANDGMLHAFYADGADAGKEAWAFIPTAVMSNMYKLADSSYSSRHTYFVDGAPVVGDIYYGGEWKTILVGGLNSGGNNYYALDVTDPSNPSVLWEFSDANLGLTFGNPIVAKRANGVWTVAFTSGYNNTAGDGRGHLYVLNAYTGVTLLDISTNVGTATTPSGLGKLNGWIADASNNTVLRYYAGDLLGNLWRFDVDNLYQPNQAALLLAQFQTPSGVAQPITTTPKLATYSSRPVVIVGTGRYLGTSDISDATVQSMAAVKDSLSNTGVGVIRSNSSMVKQTVTVSADGLTKSSTSNPVDWATQNGWWFDLPISGERVVADMKLASNYVVFGTAIPKGSACTSGGSSWLCMAAIGNGSLECELHSENSLIVGLTTLTTASGASVVLVKDSTGKMTTEKISDEPPSGAGSPHRTSWRELVN